MSILRPVPPTRLPKKIFDDPELRDFFMSLTRSLYYLWEHSRKLELTLTETTITHTAPGAADYAIQDLTNSSPFGFADLEEGRTVLQVIANLQTRVNELEEHFIGE
jgi:hypothetical protein